MTADKPLPLVTTIAEAVAAKGTKVRVRGTAQRTDAFTAEGGGGAGSGPVRQGKQAGAKQWRLTGCTIP